MKGTAPLGLRCTRSLFRESAPTRNPHSYENQRKATPTATSFSFRPPPSHNPNSETSSIHRQPPSRSDHNAVQHPSTSMPHRGRNHLASGVVGSSVKKTEEYYQAREALQKSKEQQKKRDFQRQFIVAASEEAKEHFKSEQKSRITAFLHSLRDEVKGQRVRSNGKVESQWELAVEAIQHAASCGAPITSDMIGEAIELCAAEKRFNEAEKLFFKFHYDYQLHRGARATKAFFKVCEATGNFPAAHRLACWSAEQLEIAEANRKSMDEGVHLLAVMEEGKKAGATSTGTTPQLSETNRVQSEQKEPTNKQDKKAARAGATPPPLSADIFTSYLRSVYNTPNPQVFNRCWFKALSFYTSKRFHPTHASKCSTTADLLDAILQVQTRAADWAGAVTTLRRAIALVGHGKAGSSPSSLRYVYDSTIDSVLAAAFKAHRHFEVIRTLQCATALSQSSVKPKGYSPRGSDAEEAEVGWTGGGGGGGYVPDEAAARMGIFSAEEVSATTYGLILGTNLPGLMQERAYLEYTKATFGKQLAEAQAKMQEGTQTKSIVVSSDSFTPTAGTPYDCATVCLSQTDLEHRKNAWQLSLQLFRGLADGGYPLFPQTYESPIRACLAAGRWEHAARMVLEIKRDERPVPQHYIYAILCESVAHSDRPGQGQYAYTRHPLLADYAKISSLPYIAAMRQALQLNQPSQFIRASQEMRTKHKEDHLKSKLTIEFGSSAMSGNWMLALAAFSRLSNARSMERQRLLTTSNFISYPVLAGVNGTSADALVQKEAKHAASRSNLVSSYVDTALAFSPVMLLKLEAAVKFYVQQQVANKNRALDAVKQREEKEQRVRDKESSDTSTANEDGNLFPHNLQFEEEGEVEETPNYRAPTPTSRDEEKNKERASQWDARKEENLQLGVAVLREVRNLLYPKK